MPSPPKVALLIQSGLEYGRGLLRGIGSYIQTHDHWIVFHRVGLMPSQLSPQLRKWRPQGIIGQFESPRILRQVRRLEIPCIDLFALHRSRNIPRFLVDHAAVSKMAADHFLELGYRNFAYCGFRGVYYSERRRAAFVQYVQQKGCCVDVFESTPPATVSGVLEIESAGQFDIDKIGRWLYRLPKPLAVMAGTDTQAKHLLEACRLHDLAVPADVSVMGVGNDEVLCNLADPPLTSIALRAEQIGYQAADMLAMMMRGERPSSDETFFGPLCVVSRQSTNSLAITDPDVRKAVCYLRDHFTRGVSIGEVVRQVGVSQSTLLRRFQEALGRSPHAELVRLQIGRVTELLRETNLPLSRIAELAGFNHTECMMKLFKEKMGVTPGHFRNQSQHTGSTGTRSGPLEPTEVADEKSRHR